MLKYGSGKMWENRRKAGMSVPPVTGKSSLLYFIDRLLAGRPAPFDEHILLVHECCMDQEGIDAAKAVMTHPFVAVCPLSNLFIHNVLPPIGLMRRNALKICVGTDSLSSNDDLNIVDELFCLQRNFPEVPLGELLPAELPGSPARGTAHLGLPQRGGIPGQAGIRRPGTGPSSGTGFHRPPGCGRPPDCRV